MDLILNILIISASVISLLITVSKCFEVNKANKKTKQIIKEFLESPEPGEACLDLIYDGYLQTLKVQNHSKDFSDSDFLSKFIKYSNEDVKISMKRVSETYEKFVL